jgi:hypothetical protein
MEIGCREVKKIQGYYKYYDSMYLTEEYQILVEMIPSNNHWFRKALKQFLKNEYIYTQKFKKVVLYRNFSQYICYLSQKTFVLMYQLPFKKLPLYVNERNALCSLVLRWRLTIGK